MAIGKKQVRVRKVFLIQILMFLSCSWAYSMPVPIPKSDTILLVPFCKDFLVSGNGEHVQWQQSPWHSLQKLDEGGKEYKSRFKIMYSLKGIYVLFYGEDLAITSPFKNDFENLFEADVFEVFFHPQPSEPLYFEYEISPLNKELVLLIVNRKGKFGGWAPWPYKKETQVEKKVVISGGKMESGATIKAWTAEVFFPYTLLKPLQQVPPSKGMRWKANFCRLDYDSGKMIKWAWAPVKTSFHEFERYFTIQFE